MHGHPILLISSPLPNQLVPPTPHSTTVLNSRSYVTFPSTPPILQKQQYLLCAITLAPATAFSMTFSTALALLTSLVSSLPTENLPTIQSSTSNPASLKLMSLTSIYAHQLKPSALQQQHHPFDHLLLFHNNPNTAKVADEEINNPLPEALPYSILHKQTPLDYNLNSATNTMSI